MRYIVTFMACLLLISAAAIPAFAQQEGAGADKFRPGKPVEWSNFSDKDAPAPGGALGVVTPGQEVYSEPPDQVSPAVDSRPHNALLKTSSNEVDAMANHGDAYFTELWDGQNVALIVSFQGDPIPAGAGQRYATHYETQGGNRGRLYSVRNMVMPTGLDDLDGIEEYGPKATGPGGPFDATCHSNQGDFATGWSVWVDDLNTLVRHYEIVNAVRALGCDADSSQIDVDALMVWDIDKDWSDVGDRIIFSIRAAGNWDGGEIVKLAKGTPNTQSFLVHGGHTWNTPFNVQQAFGVNTEEVDAIEAGPTPDVPSLTTYGIVALAILLVVAALWVYRRKRVRVAA